jgi:hypothetical protein
LASTLNKNILKQYTKSLALSSPNSSTSREMYKLFEQRKEISKQNKKQLIKKLIRNPMNNVLLSPDSPLKATSKVTASHNLSILHNSSTLKPKYAKQSSLKTISSKIINKSKLSSVNSMSKDSTKNISKIKKYTRLSNFDKGNGNQ